MTPGAYCAGQDIHPGMPLYLCDDGKVYERPDPGAARLIGVASGVAMVRKGNAVIPFSFGTVLAQRLNREDRLEWPRCLHRVRQLWKRLRTPRFASLPEIVRKSELGWSPQLTLYYRDLRALNELRDDVNFMEGFQERNEINGWIIQEVGCYYGDTRMKRVVWCMRVGSRLTPDRPRDVEPPIHKGPKRKWPVQG